MKTFKIALISAAVAASASTVAVAATDGLLDLTSTGTSIITIIKQNAVQITNVNDIDLGTHFALAADEVASDDVCVFSSTGSYDITLTSGAGPAFEMNDGGGTPLAYAVNWTTGGTTTPAVSGAVVGTFTSTAVDPTCSGGTNANFEVTVNQADFNAAPNGTYTDTLTLVVTPQ